MQMTNIIETPDKLTKQKIVALIPAYNEERFIGSVVLKAGNYADLVIVVDDGSSDQTAEVALAAGAVLVRHPQNLGKGMALNSGFRKARELGADVVVTIDADGQHLPEELTRVVQPVKGGQADIVVGSRYIERGSNVPRHRILGHFFFNFLTNQASGTHVSDSQSGFRAFSRPALDALSFSSNGFSVESEMQFIAHEHNLRMAEVPITIQYNDPPKRSVIGHGWSVLNGVIRLASQYRPLLIFGLAGLLLLLLGLVWGVVVLEIFYRSRTLAAGYAMLSVLFTIIGTLTMSTGVILHTLRAMLITIISTRLAQRPLI